MEDFNRIYTSIPDNNEFEMDIYIIMGEYYYEMDCIYALIDKRKAYQFYKKIFANYPELATIMCYCYQIIVVDLNHQFIRIEFVSSKVSRKYRAEFSLDEFNFVKFLKAFHSIVPITDLYHGNFPHSIDYLECLPEANNFLSAKYLYTFMNNFRTQTYIFTEHNLFRIGVFFHIDDAGMFRYDTGWWIRTPEYEYDSTSETEYEDSEPFKYQYYDFPVGYDKPIIHL